MTKTQFIENYAVGDEVNTVFLIGAATQGQARNGPFWKLELRDATGSLEAKIWSPMSQNYPALAAGDMAEVAGRISMYRERLEIAVDRLRLLGDEERAALDTALFMPASERPAAELLDELKSLCKRTLTYGPWKKLVLGVLNDAEVAPLLLAAPAAKFMHHAYAGGLLEHTLGVATLCMAIADRHPDLDRQTLLAGAVFHDIGKVWELTSGLATEYTDDGQLLGHMQLMLDFLAPRIRKSGLEDALASHLKHLILSHHGRYEFGSAKLPQTMEAMVLHHADDLDAKLNQMRGVLGAIPDGETGWSPRVFGLDRALFKPPLTPGSLPGEGAEKPKKQRRNAASDGSDDDGLPGQLSLLGDM